MSFINSLFGFSPITRNGFPPPAIYPEINPLFCFALVTTPREKNLPTLSPPSSQQLCVSIVRQSSSLRAFLFRASPLLCKSHTDLQR